MWTFIKYFLFSNQNRFEKLFQSINQVKIRPTVQHRYTDFLLLKEQLKYKNTMSTYIWVLQEVRENKTLVNTWRYSCTAQPNYHIRLEDIYSCSAQPSYHIRLEDSIFILLSLAITSDLKISILVLLSLTITSDLKQSQALLAVTVLMYTSEKLIFHGIGDYK